MLPHIIEERTTDFRTGFDQIFEVIGLDICIGKQFIAFSTYALWCLPWWKLNVLAVICGSRASLA
jgi:hypothetical protein